MWPFSSFSFNSSSSTPQETGASQQQQPSQLPAGIQPEQQQQTVQQPASPQGVQSPLDKFNSLWQINPQDVSSEGKQFITVDPAKLAEATGKLNFAAAVPQDTIQAILSGGEQAVTAFQQALNAVAQQVFQTAMLGSGRLVESALKQARSDVLSQIPQVLKQEMVMGTMQRNFPGINHPSVKPLMAVLQSQFASQFPEASPEEIQQMAAEYLTGVSKLLAKPDEDRSSKAKAGEIDWSNFFSS